MKRQLQVSRSRRTRLLSSMALAVVLAIVATACSNGSSSGSGGSTGAASGGPSPTKDATIAAEVPSDIASAGTVAVATDASYAPNEFIDQQTQQITGMDVDLGHAIATVLGLTFNFQNASFDTIIPGLQSGKFGLGMSSFTDTKERQQVVDMVTYFSAGTSFYTKASGGASVTDLSSLCGMAVGVESGTTQQADATAQGKKCTSEGKQTVTVQVFPDQNGANLALSSARVQVVMADSPVAEYAVTQSNGQFALVGNTYGSAPYGIAVPRPKGTPPGQAPMSKPILDALNKLIADGVYQQILTKWGVQAGAISTPQINGATS
jgi:polar amino acid transport system substrate-binding protein